MKIGVAQWLCGIQVALLVSMYVGVQIQLAQSADSGVVVFQVQQMGITLGSVGSGLFGAALLATHSRPERGTLLLVSLNAAGVATRCAMWSIGTIRDVSRRRGGEMEKEGERERKSEREGERKSEREGERKREREGERDVGERTRERVPSFISRADTNTTGDGTRPVDVVLAVTSTAGAVTSLIIAGLGFVAFIRKSPHLLGSMLLWGLAMLGAIFNWATPLSTPFYDTLLAYQIDSVVTVTTLPLAHLILRQLIDNDYSRADAVVSAVSSALVSLYFLFDLSMELFQFYNSSGKVWQYLLYALGDICSATAFIAQIFVGFAVARKYRDSRYSPLTDVNQTPREK